ncbi:MAG: helix-turn-helix domain-containing protein [Xenococcaceae cyanobacterium]
MFIRNDLEYNNTKERAEKFERTIAQLKNNKIESLKDNPQRRQINIEECQTMLKQLRKQIAEYERVRYSDRSEEVEFKLTSLNDLAKILIHARIAAKLSQKELAERLGIASDRVAEYEDKEYQTASWVEVMEVCEGLGLQMQSTSMKIDFRVYNQMTEAINYCNSVTAHG